MPAQLLARCLRPRETPVIALNMVLVGGAHKSLITDVYKCQAASSAAERTNPPTWSHSICSGGGSRRIKCSTAPGSEIRPAPQANQATSVSRE